MERVDFDLEEYRALRAEIIQRYRVLVGKVRDGVAKRHGVPPT